MRLFIAIRLSDEMKKVLIGCMHDLKKQGVEGNYVPAENYVKELRSALKENGIPCDKEKFVPHITLIRKASSKKPYQVRIPKAEAVVKKVSLMRFEQKDGKVVYKEL